MSRRIAHTRFPAPSELGTTVDVHLLWVIDSMDSVVTALPRRVRLPGLDLQASVATTPLPRCCACSHSCGNWAFNDEGSCTVQIKPINYGEELFQGSD
uniref:Uncharacterized protein n=1 Tax=Arundo donax TaxID=35708 RepID=A0A0A9BC02_ARUDO